jgi:hypothetical protein
MNSPLTRRALAGAAVAAAILLTWWLSAGPGSAPEPGHLPSVDGVRPDLARPPVAPAGPAATGAQTPPSIVLPAPNGKTFPTEPGPSPDAPKPTTGYRPAAYLRFNSGEPPRSGGDDGSNPTFLRILELTQADTAQQPRLLEAWHAHEEVRRALWVTARPRFSGPRLLDPEKLREADAVLLTGLSAVLRPEQAARLAAELPPARFSPQPVEAFTDFANPGKVRLVEPP